ncbi:hypothetical protein EJ06DRAFT_529568 [Trichodelitschia bisporula]|uniref:Uncharacterized protein n=1 Tax=Trichodelitschia bisporula TaxID=703511 RepID=A0A6G1HZV1_9PEZI|nr:hypothetical protein EJ06DRAFT_529568 [Trichodelitschia bisporula]
MKSSEKLSFTLYFDEDGRFLGSSDKSNDSEKPPFTLYFDEDGKLLGTSDKSDDFYLEPPDDLNASTPDEPPNTIPDSDVKLLKYLTAKGHIRIISSKPDEPDDDSPERGVAEDSKVDDLRHLVDYLNSKGFVPPDCDWETEKQLLANYLERHKFSLTK